MDRHISTKGFFPGHQSVLNMQAEIPPLGYQSGIESIPPLPKGYIVSRNFKGRCH